VKYKYNFYETPELIAASIEVDVPLPQVREGAEIVLKTDPHSNRIGATLMVDRIQVVLGHNGHHFVHDDINVYCTLQA
jgi:hypothetical protein